MKKHIIVVHKNLLDMYIDYINSITQYHFKEHEVLTYRYVSGRISSSAAKKLRETKNAVIICIYELAGLDCIFNNKVRNQNTLVYINLEQYPKFISEDNEIGCLKKFVDTINNNFDLFVDYSKRNIDNLINTINITTSWLPYSCNPDELLDPFVTKDLDVCVIHSSYPRRLQLLDLMKEVLGKRVTVVKGFGEERDKVLSRAKIVVNTHADENTFKVFETIRCNRLAYNKTIIISECSENESEQLIFKHMIFVPYNDIVNKIKEVLDNYDTVHHDLFEGLEETIAEEQEQMKNCSI